MDAETLAFLSAVPCFRGLTADELEQVSHCARRRDLRRGEIIVRAGQRADALYIIRRGYVRLVATSAGTEDRVLAVQGPGTTFNEEVMSDGGPSLATAQSLLAGTRIDAVPASVVSHLLATNPHLAHNVVQVLTGRVRHLVTLIDDLASQDRSRPARSKPATQRAAAPISAGRGREM